MKKVISLVLSIVMIFSTVLCADLSAYAEDVDSAVKSTTQFVNNSFEKLSVFSSDAFSNVKNFFSAIEFKPLTAAVTTYTSGDFEYTVDKNGNATITKYKGSATSLTIPNTIGGYTVSVIGKNVFKDFTNIKSVVLPNTLQKINAEAFRNTGISSIVIPNTVTYIGAAAFLACSNLSSVKLSTSLTEMGGYAFGDCDALTSIKIPASLKKTTKEYYGQYIYDYHYGVFIASDNLKTITFENGITTIAEGLFANNQSITSISIPNTVTEIGSFAFKSSANLKTVTLSSKLQKINAEAFRNTGISSIVIPNTVTYIGAAAFLACSNLSSVKLSTSLTEMGGYAFGDCDALTSIEIP
ncbi:MAG: leucine-rich repeat domain-containing protein, partial [Eubacterium sp.]|nr:leucine-rich repeat domain-containing protein [Eubacterium sp.]